MQGRRVVVTGATSGIGEAAALALAQKGAQLTLVARNPTKAEATLGRLRAAVPTLEVDFVQADLGSQADIRRAAAALLEDPRPIHVLFNNAGVMNLERQTSPEGFEQTWAINHLGYFLLTTLLLDRLRASAPARIINTASNAYRFVKGIDFDDLQFETRRYRGMAAYGQSKLANILFTRSLARRLEGSDITAHSYHPGAVRTSIGHNNDRPFLRWITSWLPGFRTPAKGAATAVMLASEPVGAERTGRYWYDGRELPMKGVLADDDAAERLWAVSETQVAERA